MCITIGVQHLSSKVARFLTDAGEIVKKSGQDAFLWTFVDLLNRILTLLGYC